MIQFIKDAARTLVGTVVIIAIFAWKAFKGEKFE